MTSSLGISLHFLPRYKIVRGTLSTCTPNNLLHIIYIRPPVQSDILNLAELVSYYLVPVIHENIESPECHR